MLAYGRVGLSASRRLEKGITSLRGCVKYTAADRSAHEAQFGDMRALSAQDTPWRSPQCARAQIGGTRAPSRSVPWSLLGKWCTAEGRYRPWRTPEPTPAPLGTPGFALTRLVA